MKGRLFGHLKISSPLFFLVSAVAERTSICSLRRVRAYASCLDALQYGQTRIHQATKGRTAPSEGQRRWPLTVTLPLTRQRRVSGSVSAGSSQQASGDGPTRIHQAATGHAAARAIGGTAQLAQRYSIGGHPIEYRWHRNTVSSLPRRQLPPGRTDKRKTTGRTKLLEDGHHRRYRRGRRTLWDNAGRMEQPSNTAASGLHDHAITGVRAYASFRCTGLGADNHTSEAREIRRE